MRSVLLAGLILLAPAAGCLSTNVDVTTDEPQATPGNDQVHRPGLLVHTRLGTITLVLYPSLAPTTVDMITTLAEDGWYNGTTFYRTVDDFVIQGGPQDGREPADTIIHEPGGYFAAGTLGLARDLDRDSGTSHVFVTEYPQEHLHDPNPRQSAAGTVYGSFTAFGQVVDGMDVVRAIAALPQAEAAPGVDDPSNDRPADPPEMTVEATTLELSQDEDDELPYRTWGRQRAPPYRIAVDSPGTLPADDPTWLRVFVEEEDENAPQLDPTIRIQDRTGEPLAIQTETHPDDPNLHRVETTFHEPGDYTLEVTDGERTLATFELTV